MNTETGTIIYSEALYNLSEEEKLNHMEVKFTDMTKKQLRQKKVSLHDHSSKLGKQLTNIRASKKMKRWQKR